MDENFVTVQEAARELQVADGTVRLALSQGRLPFVEKFGRKIISRADVEAYRQRTQPSGEKRVGRPRKQESTTSGSLEATNGT